MVSYTGQGKAQNRNSRSFIRNVAKLFNNDAISDINTCNLNKRDYLVMINEVGAPESRSVT